MDLQLVFPKYSSKDFRQFQLVSNLLTYYRIFNLATKFLAFFNVLKFVTSLVTNLVNGSLTFYNPFIIK